MYITIYLRAVIEGALLAGGGALLHTYLYISISISTYMYICISKEYAYKTAYLCAVIEGALLADKNGMYCTHI